MSATINTRVQAGVSVRGAGVLRPVWLVVVGASVAGVAVAGAYEGVVRAAGVSLEMDGESIPAGGFVGFAGMWAVAGVLFALAVARWGKRPGRTYAVTAWAIVVASLALPFVMPGTAVSTQLVLALSHLVVGAVVISPVARRLARVR